MKRWLKGLLGAVAGYAVVALTLGWFVTNDLAMVGLYVAGMVVGFIVAMQPPKTKEAP